MLVGLRYLDPDQCSCSTAYLECHLPVHRYCTSKTPNGPREVQQGTGISSIDQRPLPIPWGTSLTHKAHPAPINRSFIEKYCMPRQAQQLGQDQQQLAANAPPLPPHQPPSLESILAHMQRMELQMHAYMQHLADQQVANHRGQVQLNDSFYQYTLHQQHQDPNPYLWPTLE